MEFSESQIERYSRQMIMPEVGVEGQKRLLNSSVLVVGAGGLGSPCLLYLAAAGVGRLGVVDFDGVELSNLGRQIIHTETDVGSPKIESAEQKLRQINSDIKIETYQEKLSLSNIATLTKGYDFIIDGTDNFAAKYLINDYCVAHNLPFNIAGILKYEGHCTTVLPGESACFRCLFPEPPPPESVPTCASAGVLGPIAGTMGSLQATEALKFLTKKGKLLTNIYLSLDLYAMEFKSIKYTRNKQCRACGENPDPLQELADEYCHVNN